MMKTVASSWVWPRELSEAERRPIHPSRTFARIHTPPCFHGPTVPDKDFTGSKHLSSFWSLKTVRSFERSLYLLAQTTCEPIGSKIRDFRPRWITHWSPSGSPAPRLCPSRVYFPDPRGWGSCRRSVLSLFFHSLWNFFFAANSPKQTNHKTRKTGLSGQFLRQPS